MTKFFAALALVLAIAPSSFATSEPNVSFTHFHDYDPADHSYSKKSKSTLGHAQSAELLINGTTGLCFSGPALKGELLVNQMIDVYNEAAGFEELSLTKYEVVESNDSKKTILRFVIGQKTADGVAQIEFGKVRRCL